MKKVGKLFVLLAILFFFCTNLLFIGPVNEEESISKDSNQSFVH